MNEKIKRIIKKWVLIENNKKLKKSKKNNIKCKDVRL